MGTGNTKQLQASSEVKAFIYQQVQDLESYVKDLGSLGVYLEEADKESKVKGEQYSVTFVIAPENYNLKVSAQADDIYQACLKAKDEVMKKTNQLLNAIGNEQRSATLQAYSQGQLYLH